MVMVLKVEESTRRYLMSKTFIVEDFRSLAKKVTKLIETYKKESISVCIIGPANVVNTKIRGLRNLFPKLTFKGVKL